MDKVWLINYLKPEHLSGMEDLQDVSETCGIEVVKKILMGCETLRLYVPKIQSIKALCEFAIVENKDFMELGELQSKTGLSREKIKEIIKEAENKIAV